MRKIRSGKTRLLAFGGGGGVILVSVALTLVGELAAMLAWWISIALLLPPLLWASKTRHVALIVICGLGFSTQFITVPISYIYRDNFPFGDVKPFGFTAWEAFPMLAKVSLFLFALIIFFRWFYRISFFGWAQRKLRAKLSHASMHSISGRQYQFADFHLKPRRNSWLYMLLIILVIAATVPLNLWMFSRGISIVGAEPPSLPYKLAGILHYVTRYIIPLLLAYLYLRTKRNWFGMLILIAYAWILGLSSLSRSSFMFVVLPVLLLAWLDRRQLMLFVAGLGGVVGYYAITLARSFVLFATAGKSYAVTDINIGAILLNILSDPDSKILKYDSLVNALSGIFGRIDGFTNLVMSQYYNPYAVLSPFGFILRQIWRGLAPLDVDLHHLQWQGNVLPTGFYNGGALLSNAVIVGNAGIWWVVISAVVAAATLAILEKSTKRLFMHYKAPGLIGAAIIGFLSMVYFIETGGSQRFVYPFAMLLIVSLLPPLFRLDKQRPSKLKVLGVPQVALPAPVNNETTAKGAPS